jgi:hypothetical protein
MSFFKLLSPYRQMPRLFVCVAELTRRDIYWAVFFVCFPLSGLGGVKDWGKHDNDTDDNEQQHKSDPYVSTLLHKQKDVAFVCMETAI